MSVIINKFEIVPQETSKPDEQKTEHERLTSSVVLSPLEIQRAVIHYAERKARIRAH